MLALVKKLQRDYVSNPKLCPDTYLLCSLLKILKFIHYLTCIGCLNGSLLGLIIMHLKMMPLLVSTFIVWFSASSSLTFNM